MSRISVMQPYFLPYVGYFQLIAASDTFVIYDNIKYTKRGWINRNRILQGGKDVLFTLPLKKDSDYLSVAERFLATDYNRTKLLHQFENCYRKAPFFRETWPLLTDCVQFDESNLFKYIHHSVLRTCEHLQISTNILVSSSLTIDHSLTAQNKVLTICKALAASEYLNAIGGVDLYDPSEFNAQGLGLKFICSKPYCYNQFGGDFIPWLSIVDVLMFNPLEKVVEYLKYDYDLIDGPFTKK